MKNLAFVLVLTALFSVFCSCDNAPKAYQEMEKKVGELSQKIQETDDCDELQLLGISILGLMSDLENMQQDKEIEEKEIAALSDMIVGLEASLNGRITAYGCNQSPADGEEIDVFGEDDYED